MFYTEILNFRVHFRGYLRVHYRVHFREHFRERVRGSNFAVRGLCAFLRKWNCQNHFPEIAKQNQNSAFGPHPQYGWDFPEEIPEKFRKDPGNALRAFPGIPLGSTAGIPQTL